MKKQIPKPPDGWTSLVRLSGLVEWVCSCGVGHPAPPECQIKKNYNTVHGCCGCCSNNYKGRKK